MGKAEFKRFKAENIYPYEDLDEMCSYCKAVYRPYEFPPCDCEIKSTDARYNAAAKSVHFLPSRAEQMLAGEELVLLHAARKIATSAATSSGESMPKQMNDPEHSQGISHAGPSEQRSSGGQQQHVSVQQLSGSP